MEEKIRFDLDPTFAREQMAKVLTRGAEIHGAREWEDGRKWSEVIAALERHLIAFKDGKDYDQESGLLHIAHVMTQAAFLTEYYRIYPQGDDRRHRCLKTPKIGLDLDEVIVDWLESWCKKHGIKKPVYFWHFDNEMQQRFDEMKDDKDFWINIKPKVSPKDLPFEPHCYITSRSIDKSWTEEWLQKNGFTSVPLYSIGFGESKVEAAKLSGIEWFIDDSMSNFTQLNNAGICTFLMDCDHNKKYDVGYKRIMNFDDFFERFLK